MKKIIPLLIVIFTTSIIIAGESKYQDVPGSITADMQEFQTLNAYYEEQSKKRLDYFNSQFANANNRSFYVTYRIYQGDIYEQVFVKVERLENDIYIGNIASSPMGKVDFNDGDPIEVKREDVRDWTIVGADGEEEGNYLGKFAELYEAGLVVFISKISPVEGKYAEFEVVSALNPKTKQKVTDLVSQDTKQQIQSRVAQEYADVEPDSKEARYVYNFAKFPSWEAVSEDQVKEILNSKKGNVAQAPAAPADSASALANATEFGNLLSTAVKKRKTLRLKKLPEYKAINAYLKANKCPGFKYKAYRIKSQDTENFYLVASKGKAMIIGRHFKAPITQGAIDVASFESSTNSCLNLGVIPSNAAAMTATHLKPYPNEFHVLQSNLRNIALYISTSEARYSINEGKIRLLE